MARLDPTPFSLVRALERRPERYQTIRDPRTGEVLAYAVPYPTPGQRGAMAWLLVRGVGK